MGEFGMVKYRLLLCLAIMSGGLAHAAGLPGTVLPGQIERQFQQVPMPQAEQQGGITVPEPRQGQPGNAAEIRFFLQKILIESATVYTEADLLPYYQELQGREIALSDIYQVAARLTAKYRNDGYILSRVVVPAQSVDGGVVRLRAVEAYVAQVRIEGDRRDVRKLVESYTGLILEAKPLTASVLERSMLLINDLPGVFASATVQASETEVGAADLIIHFSQRTVLGGLTLDNRGGRALGPGRISADVSFNSLLGMQDFTSLRYVTSTNGELDFISLAHEEMIGAGGGKLGISYSHVESTPEEMAFIPLNLETKSDSGAITYSYPVIRSRAQNLRLRGSLTYHDGETEIFGVLDTRDRIRALRVGASYDLADSWHGVNVFDLEVSHGLKGLGASSNDDPFLSRINGNVDFSKLALYGARLQALAPKWSLLAAISAQYAFDDLLASELFGFGGEQFGRGYDPSELVGDHGAALKLEVRYSDMLPGNLGGYTGYAFYDVGKVYQRTPGGLESSESAASAGLGLRLGLGSHATGFIEVAKPLTREVAAEENRDMRGYAGITWRF
jgi:hemolysin activation/secretion protein